MDGSGIVQGDAAGAILVERAGPASYGLLVIDACASRLDRFRTHTPLSSQDIPTDWVPALRLTIDAMLLRHALQPNDLGTAVERESIRNLKKLFADISVAVSLNFPSAAAPI
jgi:hypothetical protein